MEISSKSWHYRLYRYLHNIPRGPVYMLPWCKSERRDYPLPSSLCPYAWIILLGLIGTAFISLGLLLASVVVVPFWGMRYLSTKLPRFKKEGPAQKPREPRRRNPSLVVAFVKAKKSRVCPPLKMGD